MLEKVKEYYDELILDTRRGVERKYSWYDHSVFENTVAQGLGVAQFVQHCGVEFEDITPLYEKFEATIAELEEQWKENH